MHSLRYKLFIRYAVLVIVIIAAFMASLYSLMGMQLKKNAANELQADCDNISTLMDTSLHQIDDLSERIVSSTQVRKLFLEDLYSDSEEAFNNRLAFNQALFDIIKLSFNNMAISILDTSGRHVYIGNTSRFEMVTPESVENYSWFRTAIAYHGKRFIRAPHDPAFSEDGLPVVSLCRSFSPSGSADESAVLEIQFPYSRIEREITRAVHNTVNRKNIVICNEDNGVVYPYQDFSEDWSAEILFEQLRDNREEGGAGWSVQDAQGKDYLCSWSQSDYSGWTTFGLAAQADLYSEFYRFRSMIALLTVISLLTALFITDRIARRLSDPIVYLSDQAKRLSLVNMNEVDFNIEESGFIELDSLYKSMNQMKENLKYSLDAELEAKTAADRARYLALQSQMNPHFLYNTLAAISALSEEGENDQVIEVCDNLSKMMRYISSGFGDMVYLQQEIEQTETYMQLIKVRYEDRIQFYIQIDPFMRRQRVPRLIIQPLIENCVKYSLTTRPPWKISVTGFIDGGHWILKVTDSGNGFTDEYIRTFLKKTEKFSTNRTISELEINGMGLLNLFIRLKLCYNEGTIFELSNDISGGACVKIGGPYSESDVEKNEDINETGNESLSG